MTALQRHPVGVSVVGVAALMAFLMALVLAVPVSGNAEHFGRHAALAVPLLLMLVLVTRTWAPLGPGLGDRLARGTLMSGLAVSGVGLLVEAVGAFGYSADGSGTANELVRLHDVGVALWPLGFVLLSAGAVMSVGVAVAERHQDARSKMVVGAAVLVGTAAILFLAGAFVFGY